MRLLDLLVAGKIDQFNSSRGQRVRVDLFGVDLSGRSLVGVDLSGANLGKSDLTTADLSESTLYKADLDGVDASGANLRSAMVMKARLNEAWLEDADLTGADLSGADLAEANMCRTRGAGLKLVGARMREVDATEAQWPGVDLSEARLHKTNLTRANLEGAKLDEITAGEAVFDEARLDGSGGRTIRMGGARFERASMVGVRWAEADLSGANLAGANLEGADLTRCNLMGADLTGARLVGAKLREAALEGAKLDGASLGGADLTGVNIDGLGLSDAQRDGLVGSGVVRVAVGAPLRFADVRAAAVTGAVAVVWINQDAEAADGVATPASLRCGVARDGAFVHETLPIQAPSVLAHGVVAAGDAFLVVVLVDRPGGAQIIRFELAVDGAVGAPQASALGYEAGVEPVFASDEDGAGAVVWGLARRGPSLVIQRVRRVAGADGLSVTSHIERTPTARGFLGRHAPVLACKGDVVTALSTRGASAPLRMPADASRARHLAAVHAPGGAAAALLIWAVPAAGREKGGLRLAQLGGRGAPLVESMSAGMVGSLDAGLVAGIPWWVWSEAPGIGQPASVKLCNDQDRAPVDLGLKAHVDEVRLALGPLVHRPYVVVVTLDEALVVVDADGERMVAVPS